VDLVNLAHSLDREKFIAECPFPLLLAVNEPLERTSQEIFAEEVPTSSVRPAVLGQPSAPPRGLKLHAVRKAQTALPNGIVVGRTMSCDIVILDHSVSKAHALFQEVGGRWTLSDLGSRNGTHVGHEKAQPNGDALPLKYGDIISFAFRTFFFLPAADVWDRLNQSES
jgi:hypothetical protein